MLVLESGRVPVVIIGLVLTFGERRTTGGQVIGVRRRRRRRRVEQMMSMYNQRARLTLNEAVGVIRFGIFAGRERTRVRRRGIVVLVRKPTVAGGTCTLAPVDTEGD